MQLELTMFHEENPLYLKNELITYIGNKRGLIPLIAKVVTSVKRKLKKDKLIFLDLFAGSGVVSRYMKAHAELLVANDLELYAKIVNSCYLSNRSAVDWDELSDCYQWLTNEIAKDWRRGFIAELYAPLDDTHIMPGERVFYTRRNAEYIDTARQHIARLPANVQRFFLAPLIVKASIHNNTGGVFKGFYKNRKGVGAFGGEGAHALTRILGEIYVHYPLLSQFECDTHVIQAEAIAFSNTSIVEYDLVYLDPPYNQHPYGSNYFMLNLISTYEPPQTYSKVSGIPDDWTRSPFNKPQATRESLFTIMHNLKTKYFLISYNNEGFIRKDEFIDELQGLGKLTIVESPYNTYRASRNLTNRSQYVTEYLFLVEMP